MHHVADWQVEHRDDRKEALYTEPRRTDSNSLEKARLEVPETKRDVCRFLIGSSASSPSRAPTVPTTASKAAPARGGKRQSMELSRICA